MHDTFMSCFTTQKAASFPSPHYDGPFSAWVHLPSPLALLSSAPLRVTHCTSVQDGTWSASLV